MNNRHPKAEKVIEALKCYNGRMLIEQSRSWSLTKSDLDDMLESGNCPFRLQFVTNGHLNRPKCWLVLRDYAPPKVVTQQEVAKRLGAMTEAEYRNFLCGIDPSFKSRLARHGYRKRGLDVETYLSGNMSGNGGLIRGQARGETDSNRTINGQK